MPKSQEGQGFFVICLFPCDGIGDEGVREVRFGLQLSEVAVASGTLGWILVKFVLHVPLPASPFSVNEKSGRCCAGFSTNRTGRFVYYFMLRLSQYEQ